MMLSSEGGQAVVTALIYAWLRKHGPDAKIPDFTSSFGGLSPGDKVALNLCFQVARNHELGSINDNGTAHRAAG